MSPANSSGETRSGCGMLEKMKIYFAGPDIFRPDAQEWAREVRQLCTARGHRALIPLESEQTAPADIFQANIASLQASDAILANLNPFRGLEPDSGTCVEVGYGLALGKPIIGYLASSATLTERVAKQQGQPLAEQDGWLRDAQGLAVENFGLPLNLMLAIPLRIVVGGIAESLAVLDPN